MTNTLETIQDYTLGIGLSPYRFTFHTYVTKNYYGRKNIGELNTILSIMPDASCIDKIARKIDGIVSINYVNRFRLIIEKKHSFDWDEILDPLIKFLTEDIDKTKDKISD
jgi:hypothetical protein